MAYKVLSTLLNTPTDRELPVVGFVVASYSALLAITGGSAGLSEGTCAIVTLNGHDTLWHYDGANWINSDPFFDSASNLTAGTFQGRASVRGGNLCCATDTGQCGYWNAIAGQFSFFS